MPGGMNIYSLGVKMYYINKQAPVGTGMSRARNSRWGMVLYVNEAGIYGGQNKMGVHVYNDQHKIGGAHLGHVSIAMHA